MDNLYTSNLVGHGSGLSNADDAFRFFAQNAPGLGQAMGGYEAATGCDIFGRQVSPADRVLGALPFVTSAAGGALHAAGGVIGGLGTVGKLAEEAEAVEGAITASERPRVMPINPNDFDAIANVPSRAVEDGTEFGGSSKKVWEIKQGVKVTHEAHPYHTNSPDRHRLPP